MIIQAVNCYLAAGGVPDPSAARYWRLKFPAGSTGDFCGVTEIEFRATVGGADLATTTATASGGTAANAFDNDTGTEWLVADGSDVGSWVATDFGSASDVAEIYIIGPGGTAARGPTEITVEYSPNNSDWYQDTRWPTYTGLTWFAGTGLREAKRLRRATAPGIAHLLRPGTPDTNEGGWTNFTIRQVITADRMPNGGGTDRVRFSLRAADAEGLTIGKAYIQVKGAGTYEFSTTPVQATFSGNPNVLIAAGQTVFTDDITLSLTDSDAVVISFFVSAASSTADALKKVASPGTGIAGGYKSGDDAATVTPAGYTSYNNGFIPDLEIWDA